jgi:cytochrome c-type biogenesis protein CcmH/NrfF
MDDQAPAGLDRRAFLGVALVMAQDSLAGRGRVGTLRDPSVLGRPQSPTESGENEAEIQAIEQRLACNCGCTLDVFTCRTTDFSCTYSPKLHREVLALKQSGLTAQQVLDAFVAKYGEKALMAPKPKGFLNLTGYLLPGAVILAAGAALVAVIRRRKAALVSAAPSPGSTSGQAAPRGADMVGSEGGPAPAVNASAEEMEGLRRALSEVDD